MSSSFPIIYETNSTSDGVCILYHATKTTRHRVASGTSIWSLARAHNDLLQSYNGGDLEIRSIKEPTSHPNPIIKFTTFTVIRKHDVPCDCAGKFAERFLRRTFCVRAHCCVIASCVAQRESDPAASELEAFIGYRRYDDICYFIFFNLPILCILITKPAGNWFLLDITFYANGLFSTHIIKLIGVTELKHVLTWNIYLALAALPGYISLSFSAFPLIYT